jgi:ERCC4-type nuclease
MAVAQGAAEPLVFPVPVVIDTREQDPYRFEELYADAKDGGRPLRINTVREGLASGDYGLRGYNVAVERKSAADLFSTLSAGRRRFERELARLNELAAAWVVVEAEWSELLLAPPAHSRLNPKSVIRSVMAWQLRYPRVHWWMTPDRRFAESLTFRLLQKFHAAAAAKGKVTP